MKIAYYKIKFRLAAPLAIGSGESRNTDSDVVLDSRNKPVIPASAFAGIIRHYNGIEYNFKNDFFGYIDGEKSAESRIRFYDAVAASETDITVRDCVALENKVGKDGAKFDLEAVETGADFVTLFELHDASDDELSTFLDAIAALNAGQLRIGSKTSRGYGQIRITELSKAEFTLPEDREKWLEFEPYDLENDKLYSKIEIPDHSSKFIRICLNLKQKGAVSIRSYTVKNSEDIESADYVQLSLKNGTPVISGTSWSGAFRDRFCRLSGDKELTESLFGFVDTKSKTQSKSAVLFSESMISDYEMKVITRNSIDRFSAATKDGALYSEKTCYNGRCVLEIDLKRDIENLEKIMKILSAVIIDLDRGYLAVGGLTSVGRGLFEVTKITIDGENVTEALKAADISKMIGGAAV